MSIVISFAIRLYAYGGAAGNRTRVQLVVDSLQRYRFIYTINLIGCQVLIVHISLTMQTGCPFSLGLH